MRHRRHRTVVALLCVVAQLALGASSLGLVVCTGRDHAAIELASDDCCAGHGPADGRAGGTAFADRCCSDTPLFAADRRLSDVPRSQPAPIPVLFASLAPAAPPPVRLDHRLAADRRVPAPDRLALRAIVLRV
jgi:hypothetical protein